jgi:hypothetical protein
MEKMKSEREERDERGVVVKMTNSEMFSMIFNLNRGNILLPRVSHPRSKMGNWRIEGLELISTHTISRTI